MPKAAGSAVAPLYLFACLLLGGSAQGIWQNALLQLAGLAIIVWAAVSGRRDDLPRAARPIFVLAMAAIAVVAVQAIPLPAAGWEAASRARILRDYRLLGDGLPGFSIAVAPYASLSTLLCLIPPVAMFCAMVRLNAYRRSWLAAALLTGTTLGILLGALQVVVGLWGQSADEFRSQAEVELQLADRDRMDRERETSPMRIAPDAVVIRTDKMSVDETVDIVVAMCGLELMDVG